ncbi:LIVCS family branched-chain amino acid:cation transporter [Brevibacterium sanguinis]|uniref:LIVCS family branched-chain amino acid:cation transporter n=2 Tax=Brevibacterium TaxID=1696 RepID=A0A366IN69_9MICO|nr:MULTISPECIES: branched-chain amino acid transport system II carrier protein [Brevibacterium]RBP68065.1 LIVCS family branched-chain amino acid:cation transporter [Brevibacterium sanguinis]RBP74518.1 LIVCS family branched-chain amino acid:cation transporter [Brevibacterium celere]
MSGGERLSKGKVFALGLLLFAMFLGAGNTIFAPMVGQGAGEDMWLPMSGFLITGVGLVLLAIIALSMCGGDVEVLASRVSSKFSAVFCLLLFLALGPLYVIPRTTSVVYEITVKPSLSADLAAGPWALLVFSLVFTVLSVWLSLNPSKLVDRIGKAITPVFTILLAIIVIRSLIAPMGDPQPAVAPYTEHPFFLGFTDGYGTMDALAALVFAAVFIQSIRGLGVTSKRGIAMTFLKAGLITVVGLALLHISLAWIGASSVEAIGRPDNGGELLAEASRQLLGYPGVLMIGGVILLTGLTTNVACITCVADYLAKKFPKLGYRGWMLLVAGVGFVFANFGLTLVLSTALPVLYLLYPVGMTLIVLALCDRLFGGYRAVYVGAIVGATAIAIIDALKAAGVAVDQLDSWFSFIPFFSAGAGWVVPAVLGGLIGFIVATTGRHPHPDRASELTEARS